jgi:capsular polysaccharide export protein
MAWYSAAYFASGLVTRHRYPHYEHHKPFVWGESLCWMRALWRKAFYRVKERDTLERLLSPCEPDFFLVPLQINTDSQIVNASAWPNNEAFIEATIRSFARHADANDKLVFKHHPLERGHADYASVIARTASHADVADRVLYVHGGHVPTLLKRSKGVITVNSTMGLQALYHGVAVHTTGNAFYARPGLVADTTLDTFWKNPLPPRQPDFMKFYRYMMHTTQINTSFYASLLSLNAGHERGAFKRRLALLAAFCIGDARLAIDAVHVSTSWATHLLHLF